jgi:hypothetical protein
MYYPKKSLLGAIPVVSLIVEAALVPRLQQRITALAEAGEPSAFGKFCEGGAG